MKKAALYDPYLDVLGGGEKHILGVMKVLQEMGYEINIFWDADLSVKIEERYLFEFSNKLNFLPNIFDKNTSSVSKLNKLSEYDLFFYVTDGSYFFSSAKRNFVFCMYPKKDLYDMNLLNKLKTLNYTFLTNSNYTKKWLEKWHLNSQVLLPYIGIDFINFKLGSVKKENIILSVGRFYSHLHAKQQELIIKLFKQLKQKNAMLKDFKLIVAGGAKKEDKQYFASLKKLAGNDDKIELKANLKYTELFNLYKRAKFYWHFTGFNVDENIHPESVEHLGLSPLEAMAMGCLTFCAANGGPKDIIQDGKNGFLFETESQLKDKFSNVLMHVVKQNAVSQEAKKFVATNYNYSKFSQNVKDLIQI